MSVERTQWLLLFVMQLEDNVDQHTVFKEDEAILQGRLKEFIKTDTTVLLNRVLEESKKNETKEVVWRALSQANATVTTIETT